MLTCDVEFHHCIQIVNNHDKDPCAPSPGDILIFTQAKVETAEDLQRSGRSWTFGCVTRSTGEAKLGRASGHFEFKASSGFNLKDGMQRFFCAIFLINTSTFKRIWTALHNLKTSAIIEKVLHAGSEVEEFCKNCCERRLRNLNAITNCQLMARLNESQYKAVATCLCKLEYQHRPILELIWGPLSLLHVAHLKLKYRTLTCGPTNIAIAEVASCLVAAVRDFSKLGVGDNALFCPLGDILLFGNKDCLNVNPDIEVVFLDYCVEKLIECFGSSSAGWRNCFSGMKQFFEGFDSLNKDFWGYEPITSLHLATERLNHPALLLGKCVHDPYPCAYKMHW